MSVRKLASGGYAVSYPGEAFPVWFSDEDRGDAYAEDRARTLIAPAGTSGHPPLGLPRDSRPGPVLPTFTASGAGASWRAGGVAGDHDPRTPATPNHAEAAV